MATYEQDIAMYETKENGDKVIKLPVTRVNNVEGIGRSASAAYVVGDVVYVDNNKKVALKCTTAGTTSSGELDVSNKAIGDTVTDGSVVWKVIARSNVLDEGGVLPIANGGTGGNTFVKDASISGKTITLNMSDGTNKTLDTLDKPSDMTDYIVESYRNGTNWYRVWKSGWVEQGGTNTTSGTVTITFLKQFATTDYTFSALVYNKNTVHNYFDLRQSEKTKTSIKFTDSADQGIMIGGWYACGQGA